MSAQRARDGRPTLHDSRPDAALPVCALVRAGHAAHPPATARHSGGRACARTVRTAVRGHGGGARVGRACARSATGCSRTRFMTRATSCGGRSPCGFRARSSRITSSRWPFCSCRCTTTTSPISPQSPARAAPRAAWPSRRRAPPPSFRPLRTSPPLFCRLPRAARARRALEPIARCARTPVSAELHTLARIARRRPRRSAGAAHGRRSAGAAHHGEHAQAGSDAV